MRAKYCSVEVGIRFEVNPPYSNTGWTFGTFFIFFVFCFCFLLFCFSVEIEPFVAQVMSGTCKLCANESKTYSCVAHAHPGI